MHDLEDDNDHLVLHTRLEKLLYSCSHHMKKLLGAHTSQDLLWTTRGWNYRNLMFQRLIGCAASENILGAVCSLYPWSYQSIYIMLRSLYTYSNQSAVEGLSRSWDNYDEAITCLKSCYNRPRLIHWAHVHKIMDAQPKFASLLYSSKHSSVWVILKVPQLLASRSLQFTVREGSSHCGSQSDLWPARFSSTFQLDVGPHLWHPPCWSHLWTGYIDILLRVDVFVDVLHECHIQGRLDPL